MNKVYLLLRENRESGPFTIDDLIQQQLKPADLIWVEGKSVAWCYPYELEELKSHVPSKPRLQVVPSSNPSMVSTRSDNPQRAQVFPIPAIAASYQPDEIEAKADQIRNNVISIAQQNRLPYVRTANTEPSSGGVWSNQEKIEFVHHTRKKYVTLPQLIATGLITVLLASAWYGDWSTIRVKPNTVTIAAAPAAFNEEKPQPPTQTNLTALVDSQALATSHANAASNGALTASANPGVRRIARSDSDMVQNGTSGAMAVNTQPSTLSNTETNAAENDQKKEEATQAEKTETKKEPVINNTKPATEPEKQEITEEKEKKKKLGQVIKGIFKKKNKEDE